MLDKFPREVKLVVKHYPLASHRFARKAAAAALAANMQGKFWEFHEKLFKTYRTMNEEKILGIAKDLGLDMKQFATDERSMTVRELIESDLLNARKIGIRGVPTVFINGKRLKRRTLGDFENKIRAELDKKS